MKEKLLGARFVARIFKCVVATFDDRAAENIGDLLLLVTFAGLCAGLVARLP